MNYVIKSNGVKEPFNIEKIKLAIRKAYMSCGLAVVPSMLYDRMEDIFMYSSQNRTYSTNEIHNIVEKAIADFNFDVAKEYILYRERHKEAREIRERLDFMDKYSQSSDNAATSSETDANANVDSKNVVTCDAEVPKVKNRIIQRQRMKDKLNELSPEVAKQYEIDIENYIIYPHDEASCPTPKNYCEAVSMYPLLLDKGVGNMDGITPSQAHWLDSFVGQFNNLVFLLAAQCKGAVAFGEFFNFFDYFCVKEFGPNYHEKVNIMYTSEFVPHKMTVGDKIDAAFQSVVYYINQPAQNRGWQSPFTNFSYYDRYYWNALFGDFCFPDGSKPSWDRVSFLQKRFMKWFNKERTKAVLTFPVETMALLVDSEGYYLDSEYKEFTAEMQSEGHSFFVYISDNPNSLSSCCRLRNEIDGNEFSFTNGLSGVKTGSCNVITLNLNRIIQNWYRQAKINCHVTTDEDGKQKVERKMIATRRGWASTYANDFKEYLIDILERVYKYHIAYKSILYDWEARGMYSACNAGYISMSDLFSTIGINGLNEAARFLGIEVNYNEEYKDFCRLITGTISEQNKLHSKPGFKFNQEFVPAEGLSSKNYNWDKEDGYWVPEDTKIYNSYFYNAWDPNTSVLDKFKLHGKEFTELLDGGVGLHCNLEEHLSKEQYLKMLDFAAQNGTSYYTYNIPNSECTNPDCHYIVKNPMTSCPKCGSNMRIWTRVVGFLRPIDGYDIGRYWDATQRFYAKKESC